MTGILKVPSGQVSQFELEQFERSGDRLRVSGRWFNVRGMRFMRPTLTVGDRRVLAVLDHKPWMPEEGETWIAEFPWDGDDADIDTDARRARGRAQRGGVARLTGVPVEPAGPPEPDPLALEEERRHRLESEIAFLREQIDLLTGAPRRERAERDARAQAEAPPPTGRATSSPSCAPRSTRPAPSATTPARASTTSASAAPRPRPSYDNARIERDAAQHEVAAREELAAREVELPDEPASGTVVVPAPPPEPIQRDGARAARQVARGLDPALRARPSSPSACCCSCSAP